jgi:peptidoglycan/LPS O-acetylase OafA/YrhL
VFLDRNGLLTRPDTAGSVALNLAVGVPTVLVLSTATYLLVERPALRLRRPARTPLAASTRLPETASITAP